MNKQELRKVLELHKKWLICEGGECADLECADLSDADLSDANLRGANLDYSVMPLWCGDLKAHYDEKQIIQQLYHVLSHVKHSKNSTDRLKKHLLTDELRDLANKFHRIGEVEKI